MREDTIIAMSTPAGNAGVAVIRISGERAKEILQSLIRENIDFEPRKMYLKTVHFKDLTDKCLVVFFQNPMSYTGEDVVEIQSHGGFLIAQKIIEEGISLGARLADKGEFSKRAFVNGKISVDQAEGIMDLINAESELQLKAGNNLFQGKLKESIEIIQTQLTDILAELEAKLDYPEYEYSDNENQSIKNKLISISEDLNKMISSGKEGMIIKNGVSVAIVGAPNVGKSSLLNALTNTDKAIVTSIAGTTRDVIEAEYEYKGIIFRLFDTAGIHESDDVVEQIGIDRAKKTIENSSLIVRVSDKDNICDIKTDKPFIDIFNKSDITEDIDESSYIPVSAKTKENLNKLKEIIFQKTVSSNINADQLYLTNTRHIECVQNALNSIENALNIFDNTTLDIISSEIKSAWFFLGEITGTTSDEKIIDRIFSKFCLGK
ncbi:MAG: tRNA uridine-5-carboxymethylaminomethyl(34) synthesis GTPase MnmE [Clostridia bacterium]|nr:tRNA uridine-5-carboxymethylaminomethyl(34) synthesis GTPase MnmE [Clostridia bacterium]